MIEIERIIRVDHAGEFGAINIYRAQLFVAKIFYSDIVHKLEEMLVHEKKHFSTFTNLLISRNIRHCYALYFWAIGGAVLGLFTGLLRRNAIWVCTNSIETTVLHHLDWQLEFLAIHDKETHDAVLSIKADEEEHQEIGQSHSTNSIAYRPLFWVVRKTTELAIWLSTKL
jgi:ubiquinone biosynthesis monooxygenase Coq7